MVTAAQVGVIFTALVMAAGISVSVTWGYKQYRIPNKFVLTLTQATNASGNAVAFERVANSEASTFQSFSDDSTPKFPLFMGTTTLTSSGTEYTFYLRRTRIGFMHYAWVLARKDDDGSTSQVYHFHSPKINLLSYDPTSDLDGNTMTFVSGDSDSSWVYNVVASNVEYNSIGSSSS